VMTLDDVGRVVHEETDVLPVYQGFDERPGDFLLEQQSGLGRGCVTLIKVRA
jgi:hypothetical protein